MAEVKFLGELFLYVHVAHDTWNMGDFSGIWQPRDIMKAEQTVFATVSDSAGD